MKIALKNPIKDSFGKTVSELNFPDPPLRYKHTRGVFMDDDSVPLHQKLMCVAGNMVGLTQEELGEMEWAEAREVVALMLSYFPAPDGEQPARDSSGSSSP